MANDQSIPQSPQNLPGSLWGITTYFNPNQYKNKLENYRIFRRSSQKQGLPLICVELAFGNRPFELTEKDADILIQRRAKSVMWQKERLLNIALKNLPTDCDKVAWVDADVIFQNNHWLDETCRLLERYKVVQLFQHVWMLPKEATDENKGVSEKLIGRAYKMSQPDKAQIPDNEIFGHPGMAWAARRDILAQTGFYDKMILGSGDFLLTSGFYNEDGWWPVYQFLPPELSADAKEWQHKLYQRVQSSVYYTSGNLLHLWHGDRPFRLFYERLKILARYGFTPQDIRLNNDECWEWTTRNKRLHRWVRRYFKRRNEEDFWWDRFWAQLGNFWDFGKGALAQRCIQEFRKFILSVLLFIKNAILRVFHWVKKLILRVFLRIDWSIGQVGLFLKQHNPKMYYFLRKFKGG